MAKQEFLDNFRIARSLFLHPQVQSGSSQLDPEALQRRIARAAIWLTPKSVKGFAPSEFEELGSTRQHELSEAIQEFLGVAQQVPATSTPITEQFDSASSAFTKALAVLQPYLPVSEEMKKTEEALRTVEFPPWIANWDYELGSDHDGDPAVWVTLFADEQIAPRKEFGRFLLEYSGRIRNALTAAGIQRWPYIRMRTLLEHKSA